MDLLARARQLEAQGRDIIHMEVGEPDFSLPEPLLQRARQALIASELGYTPALGLPELRHLIARQSGAEPGEIAVTPGASGALQLAIAALIDIGDSVLVTDPGYPCNAVMVSVAGGRPLPLRCTAATRFQPTAAQVQQQWAADTRAVLLASPANPTGCSIARVELLAIADVAAENGGWLMVDEIYGRLAEADFSTVFGLRPNIIVLNSFSKYHGMTGWRLGWLQAPQPLMPIIERLAQNLFLAPSTLAQQVALVAFEPATLAICEQRRAEYGARRRLLCELLISQGFAVEAMPDGAFYVWARLPATAGASRAFCSDLLTDEGVVLTPGSDFTDVEGDRYLRIAATGGEARMREAVERIGRFLLKFPSGTTQ